MPTFYVDETGFTGEDLLSADQPIFVQATNDFSAAETKKITDTIFAGVKADELKHKKLSRKPAGRDCILGLIRFAASDPKRVATWVAHKEYAAVTMVVEWWIEPLAYKSGLNLYKDGANHAMANMLFMCLQGFWDDKFRRKLLLAFQRMVRTRTKDRFIEFEDLVTKTKETVKFDEARPEIIRYLWPSFTLLGLEHVVGLPPHVLDLALPGLVRLGHSWRGKHPGPWEVVHDRSTNMAKQKWLWDKLSAADLEAAQFDGPGGPAIFPMNVITTRFADSITEKQIQLCDLIAGATSAFLRLPENDEYRKKLADAGIEKLIVDSIWPSEAVTPQDLGKKGWDGNVALEWISAAIAKKDAGKRT